jgi:hypothetical protein
VLPRLHYCSYEIADLVRGNLDVANHAPMKDGFAQLKAQVESLYPCLGITCADVGAFQNTAGVFTGAQACTDQTPADDDDDEICGGADDAEEDDDDDTPAVTEAPATEAPATEAPATEAPATKAATTATPTEPAVVDSDAFPFAALSGIVLLVNA